MSTLSHPLMFRLFVSSTFSDMKKEREVLQAKVFPKLRDHCKARGATFQAVDLRWGISQEAGHDQQTMNICLRELKRCQEATPRPNFLILLGERYGWLPLPPQIDAGEFEELEGHLASAERDSLRRWYRRDDNAVPAEYVLLPREGAFEDAETWDQEEQGLRALLLRAIEAAGWGQDDPRRAKYEHSATHQEIDAGALALADPEDRVLACFRELPPRPDSPSSEMSSLRSVLKARLPSKNRVVYEAECTDDGLQADWDGFAEWVEGNLRSIVDREIEEVQAQATDPLDVENEKHAAFAQERAQHFIGRRELLDQIDEYLHNTEPGQPPFVVHGVSGSGKTALMAEAWRRQEGTLARFIGATPGSSNLRSLLTELCVQLRRFNGVQTEESVPNEIHPLSEHFKQLLGEVPQDRHVLLFLDALDQLDDQDGPHTLFWLPRELPANVRLVLSCLERPGEPAGRTFKAAQKLFDESRLHRIETLDAQNAASLLDNWLADAKRQLQTSQKEKVLRRFQKHGLPLWLKLVFSEALRWKSWEKIPEIPEEIPALIERFLKKLEEPENHGRELTSTTLGYLASARHGLTDDEILEVVARDQEYWNHFISLSFHTPPDPPRLPQVLWARLHGDLKSMLTQRTADETTVNAFYHRQVEEVIRTTYYEPRRIDLHTHLANYFTDQVSFRENVQGHAPDLETCTFDTRSLSELPYHLQLAHKTEQLSRILLSPTWITQKLSTFGAKVLANDYDQFSHGEAEKSIARIIKLTLPILEHNPKQLLAQFLGRLEATSSPEMDTFLSTVRSSIAKPALIPQRGTFSGVFDPLLLVLEGHKGSIVRLNIDSSSNVLESVDVSGYLIRWDIDSGAVLERHQRKILEEQDLQFRRIGPKQLAALPPLKVGPYNVRPLCEVQLRRREWYGADKNFRALIELEHPTLGIRQIDPVASSSWFTGVSPDIAAIAAVHETIFAGFEDGVIRKYDLERAYKVRPPWAPGRIETLRMIDAKRAIATFRLGELVCFDARSGEIIGRFRQHGSGVASTARLNDRTVGFALWRDKTVSVYDHVDNRQIARAKFPFGWGRMRIGASHEGGIYIPTDRGIIHVTVTDIANAPISPDGAPKREFDGSEAEFRRLRIDIPMDSESSPFARDEKIGGHPHAIAELNPRHHLVAAVCGAGLFIVSPRFKHRGFEKIMDFGSAEANAEVPVDPHSVNDMVALDPHHVVSVHDDGSLRLIQIFYPKLETQKSLYHHRFAAREVARFLGDCALTAIDRIPQSNTLIVGDSSGRLHWIEALYDSRE